VGGAVNSVGCLTPFRCPRCDRRRERTKFTTWPVQGSSIGLYQLAQFYVEQRDHVQERQ
jgi:hypothetical protein